MALMYVYRMSTSTVLLMCEVVDRPTAHDQPDELGSLHLVHRSRNLRRLFWSQTSFMASVSFVLWVCRVANRVVFTSRSLRWSTLSGVLEWILCSLLHCVLQ